MRSMIWIGCLCLLTITSQAQGNRVRSGTPLRWGMNGSIEIMEGDLATYHGSTDTNTINRRNVVPVSTPVSGNPNATRFASVQGLCSQNSVLLNWVALQHSGADRFDIEQSTNGRNWTNVGVVPANRTDFGEVSYSFNYDRNTANTLFRVSAVSNTGERVYSSIIESPCSPNAYMAITPNPAYNATTVRVGSPVATRAKLLLINSVGVVVQASNQNLAQGINSIPLNLGNVSKGYYTLVIQWNSGRQDELRLVKQ